LPLSARAGLVAGGDPQGAGLPLALVQLEQLCRERTRPTVAERCREAHPELCDERGSALRLELRPAFHEAREEDVFVLAERRMERQRATRARRGENRKDGAHFFAHDDRARHQVAQAAPVAREHHAAEADEVEEARLHVDDADEVARRRDAEGDGVALLAHHPQPVNALAGGLAVHQPFEQHVVAPEQRELRQDQHGDGPARGARVGHARAVPGHHDHERGDHDSERHDADQEVGDRGEHARADAGDGVGEHHQLGSLDVDRLFERAGIRGDHAAKLGRGARGYKGAAASRPPVIRASGILCRCAFSSSVFRGPRFVSVPAPPGASGRAIFCSSG
jgi:hypothetical protein